MTLIIYTTGNLCPRCNVLKDAFQKAHIAYEEQNMDRQVIMDCLCETQIMTQSAPLVKNNAVWIFEDDFFDKNGNLVSNWRQVLEGVNPRKAGFTGQATNSTKVQSCSKIWKE